jgi:hypothetical protein
MNNDYLIREFKQLDISGISKLIRDVLGASRDESYWKWKYCHNSAGYNISAIALFKGEIVGLLGAIPVKFSVNGKDIIGIQEVDNAVLETHRNFKLAFSMASTAKKKALAAASVVFTYGISLEDTSDIAEALLNKTIIAPLPRMVKVLDVKPFLQQRISNQVVIRFLPILLNWAIQKRSSQKPKIPSGMVLKYIDRFDKRFDEFWDRINTSYPIMVNRNTDYLNWRYVSPPYTKYKIVSVEQRETKRIMGYMVLGVKQKDYIVGNIVDIITPKNENGLIERFLIRYAIEWFYRQKVQVIRCWMFPHCHIYAELRKAGFVSRIKKGMNLIFQRVNYNNFNIDNSFFNKVENWYLCAGDSDTV